MESYQNSEQRKPLNQIPDELKRYPQWMGTRFATRAGSPGKSPGKTDKPPYRVRSGQRIVKADKTDPKNWSSFEEVSEALRRGDVDAIGFVFMESDPFFVVDLDGCVEPETGEIHAVASEIIHTLDTYTELSCSMRGTHSIGVGEKPIWSGSRSSKMGPEVEVYDRSRFMVMTGKRISTTTEPEKRQDPLEWLCQRLWIKAERLHDRSPVDSIARDIEDDALLDRARKARTGAKFRKLFDEGDTSGCESPSNADFKLINALIFWTAGDPERIARLFEASALYRTPQQGKHKNYVRGSVAKALSTYKGAFYNPRSTKVARKEAEDPRSTQAEDPLLPYLRLLMDPSRWTGRKAPSAYKAFTACVVLAEEHGVVDDEGNLRIGCDVRRLAEVAGMSQPTMSRSALPHLMMKMKLLKWKKGKGTKAGSFVLKNPQRLSDITKVPTHSSDISSAPPEIALKTLRLLVRMRSGKSKDATLLRLGMGAMFALVVMTNHPTRGYTLDELADATGRRKRSLDAPSLPESPIKRLKAAGIIKEMTGRLWLTDGFVYRYEEHLKLSGITRSERLQRDGHERDRRARAKKLKPDEQTSKLKGKDHMRTVRGRNRAQERERWIEEQRRKVGTTAVTFLDDELRGVVAVELGSLKHRWLQRGGSMRDLWHAVQFGPFTKYREADGSIAVARALATDDGDGGEGRRSPRRSEASHAHKSDETPEEKVQRLVREGMAERLAREDVFGEGHEDPLL